MIQDIFPHKFDNQYRQETIRQEDFLLVFHQGKILLKQQEEIGFFRCLELWEAVSHQKEEIRYAFLTDETKWFLLEADEQAAGSLSLEDWKDRAVWETPAVFRKKRDFLYCFVGITACQLNRWYQDEKFCSRCGHALVHHKTERAMECPSCQKLRYPVISPCVIVAVVHGEKLLMTRYARHHSTYKRYALIAGFAEIGETIEETVHREVMEETGLKVKNLRFYKSQPWSFTDTLLFGFFAQLDGSEDIVIDRDELSEAGWFLREEIPEDLDHASLTNEMIRKFKEGYCREPSGVVQ